MMKDIFKNVVQCLLGHLSSNELFWLQFVRCQSLSSSSLLSCTFHIFIIFSRTTGPISSKHSTKHSWVMGIQVCSNEGPRPFPRGDNYELAKIHWRNFKIFISRTTGPISTKLRKKASLGDGNLRLFKWRATLFSKGR